MRIDRAMDVTLARESEYLSARLGSLATIGSAGPFIGLFGTVVGIMTSFQAIAGSKSTNLAVVAPGIAEALLATAIGLVAAPYVLPYIGFSPTTINRILIWGLFGLGFDILFGYTGLLSFGQSAFFGTGGMVAAYLLTQVNFPYVTLAIVIGVVAYFFWRDFGRREIETWPSRAAWVFYAAVGLLVVDLGWYAVVGIVGRDILAFLAVAAICVYVGVRTWREQRSVL